MERTVSLKNHLSEIRQHIQGNVLVIIEDQPEAINSKSTTVQDQICYEFAGVEVFLVPSKWKNKLCFGKGLSYDEIRKNYTKSYTANKVHSKLNFLKFIEIVGAENMLEGVVKSNYDDLADSCMQIVAYNTFH